MVRIAVDIIIYYTFCQKEFSTFLSTCLFRLASNEFVDIFVKIFTKVSLVPEFLLPFEFPQMFSSSFQSMFMFEVLTLETISDGNMKTTFFSHLSKQKNLIKLSSHVIPC